MMQLLDITPNSWQDSLKSAITDPKALLERLSLPNELLEQAQAASQLFPLRVPLEFLNRMELGNPNDPLLKQVLPIRDEFIQAPGFTEDPLNESDARPTPGVVHKYKDRALLILSGACAINCRYCFRRHFPYSDNQLSGEHWQRALAYLKEHTELREVIFSGGDPLVTSDHRFSKMVADLEAIPHLERLRVHTRLPVVIPSRVTDQLNDTLHISRLNCVVVLHINHANEIDQSLSDAVTKLKQSGATILNQAVLLKGVNDSADEQVRLSRALFSAGILPYYLFLFDPVAGASHFDIPIEQGKEIFTQMQRELPGYLVPRLAKEISGKTSKTLLISS
ncbi:MULTISPECIES: EF-P beta-lysylation protein EpmB [unclassified Marinobacterium]|uniref:EF-P beta-lysylation protein EpmB n=1 Tax=unclassified Marinobacterium TaxID=2644139 RepID=UPI0019F7C0B6|nr:MULTISPECIES: EF-P beta-lysylation protein EpmB [unclassified Marinobacterium]NRP28127.1 L-lysine 2,3-aminomutase [Marinobacterium sp. xm-d-420]NRP38063.1 L-lysine 2,3-aminomutase [Marinobacterium sp. xm-a-121]NRP53782.1 L-lysine 2,3-aminomutase [Marinobacterium sp. xm-v-242]NRP58397.1 L-lysine 2,3-aminomutase [Marinobacterium sp. xm-d-510]NRP78364.1 L-lysine 2,3-aminomutase [Marinobacterium sp. xm-m-383]